MTNYLRQFEGWVTGLKDDPFFRARIRLTFEKFAIVLVLFLIAGFIIDKAYDYRLRLHLTGQLPNKAVETQIINETSDDLQGDAIVMLSILGGAVVVVGYFLAGATLRPIKQIVQAQKRFIADASHELRTPLSIMKTNAEVVLMDGEKMSANEAAVVLKSNIEEIDRMSKLIENLLRLSYYDNTAPEIPFTRVDLAEVVQSIVAKAKTLAYQKSIRLNISEIARAPVLGNPIALEQLAMNLIKNAILYTPEGGTVAVTVIRSSNGVVGFRVRDTGIGIHPDEIQNIFKPFYKSDTTKLLYAGGSGLGLAIVKKIVDRHQASIRVESDIGKGTSVTVTFPNPDKLVIKGPIVQPVRSSSVVES